MRVVHSTRQGYCLIRLASRSMSDCFGSQCSALCDRAMYLVASKDLRLDVQGKGVAASLRGNVVW